MANESVLSGFFVPERANAALAYELQDSLGVLNGLAGTPGSDAPIVVGPLPGEQKGQYFTQARFDKMASLVTRRDLTSFSAATLVQMTTDSEKAPVVNLKMGPVLLPEKTLWMAGASDAEVEMNFVKQCADQFRSSLQSHVIAAIKGSTAAFIAGAGGEGYGYDHAYSVWDNSTPVYLSPVALSGGRSEMGDRLDKINSMFTRSECFSDMVNTQAAYTSSGSWGENVARGQNPATLGLPYAIVDSSHLKTDAVASSSTLSKWYTYLMSSGMVQVEIVNLWFSPPARDNSLEQPSVYLRGDADVVIRIKGMNYASTANPSESTLATAGSWGIKTNDHKEFGIVRIETNSAAT